MAGGAAWLAVVTAALPLVGIVAPDDAVEAKNPAGVMTLCAAWVGAMLCYAGGNVGEGPTIWTTFLPAAAATGALLFTWCIIEACARTSEAITIDRDAASSLRLSGWVIGAGLVLGRSVTGDWVSWEGTWSDFARQAWFVVPMAGAVVLMQRLWRPRSTRPVYPPIVFGILPGLSLMLTAAGYVCLLGWPATGGSAGHPMSQVARTISSRTASPPFRAGLALDQNAFARVRQKLVLDCCKWDPQVGDVSTLAPFPLVLRQSGWDQLASWAEALSAEAALAEAELMAWPALHERLGIPPRVRRTLRRIGESPATPGIARVARYDFHWTTDGWRISESNSDVPGGFTEASSFTQLMAEHYPGFEPAGDPTASWCDALAGGNAPNSIVALLVASGYMEDQQVVAYLAQSLGRRGLHPHACDPSHLRWSSGHAVLDTECYCAPVAAIVRFYQGEWLSGLSSGCGWPHLLVGGLTPVSNPGSSLMTESKRFPLVWDAIDTALPTWRQLLPESRDPRDANWAAGDEWLLKAAFCNNGDTVALFDNLSPDQWMQVSRRVRKEPGAWVAQRRFEPIPVETPIGPMNPCIGVYTVDGRAAGIYGRMSPGPVIDYAAIDVAVLVDGNDADGVGW